MIVFVHFLLVMDDTYCTEKQWISQGFLSLASSHKALPRASQQNPQARWNNNRSLSVILHVLEFNIRQRLFSFIIHGSQVILPGYLHTFFRESHWIWAQLFWLLGGCITHSFLVNKNIWCVDKAMQRFHINMLISSCLKRKCKATTTPVSCTLKLWHLFVFSALVRREIYMISCVVSESVR